MHIVQYTRNVNPGDSTSEIRLSGRPNLRLGGQAVEITDDELQRLSPLVVFAYPEAGSEEYESAARVQVRDDEGDTEPAIDDLVGKSNKDLRQIANDESADITGLKSNDDIIGAIREKRQREATGLASLPATAVVGPPVPVSTGGETAPEGSTESSSESAES